MVSAIPDRWLQYKPCGKVIEGTRIICFKVPLKKSLLQKRVDVKDRWGIKELLITVPNLEAVLDLTNTNRYYDPQLLKTSGVCYKKIFMPGRILPPEDIVVEFMNAVDTFLKRSDDNLIGVHCTHGLNRTGYMVCRYMRDRLAMPAPEAIRRFELARGYQIERANFIAALLGKSVPPPELGPGAVIKPIDRGDRKKSNDDEELRPAWKKRMSASPGSSPDRRKRKKTRSSRRSDSDDSYDFKYDY